MSIDVLDDAPWDAWRQQWKLRSDTTYLNHGSFGPAPLPVREEQLRWQQALNEQPMDLYVRQHEPAWLAARQRLATFIGTNAENLVFVENATAAMNVIANSFPLTAGDEVLLNDHEYGAVRRIWERACGDVGATTKVATIPLPISNASQLAEQLFANVTPRTRLIVVSHVTSATAVIFPIAEICQRAKERGIAVVIDGPHAPAQIPLDIDALACDFYTASLHKWLSAPLGSGFLYVAPRWHAHIQTPQLSWGVLPPREPQQWTEQFIWSGTRDSSPYYAVPAAIDFMESVGLTAFRTRTHGLAQYARERLATLTNLPPLVPDDPTWYGSMTLAALPPDCDPELQSQLWKRFGIEVLVPTWNERRFLRVSCHLYNRRADIDNLVNALQQLL